MGTAFFVWSGVGEEGGELIHEAAASHDLVCAGFAGLLGEFDFDVGEKGDDARICGMGFGDADGFDGVETLRVEVDDDEGRGVSWGGVEEFGEFVEGPGDGVRFLQGLGGAGDFGREDEVGDDSDEHVGLNYK